MIASVLETLAVVMVSLAALPVIVGGLQYILVGLSSFATRLNAVVDAKPNISILIPAWNEASVIGTTIDRLMRLEYPKKRLRIYVIDDASSDATPEIVFEKSKRYPKNIFHVRRVAGGEGKAHTLNYGLTAVLAGQWTEAILIMDADVIYTPSSLRRMSRHLGNPEIGAVTAYIKEGSKRPSLVQRYVTFEYITATAAARRAQNVMGFLVCLSGGAQLHRRANIEAIGGKLFDDTLAEDTFTTFLTQIRGSKAIFEPNAIVYAEEPATLDMLWKQRLRWARGNVQITHVFKDLWFRKKAEHNLGSISMGLVWFSIFLMPLFQIGASISLLGLSFMTPAFAWRVFNTYWLVAAAVYLLVTLASFLIDAESAQKSYIEGILFPGLISLVLITNALFPMSPETLGLHLSSTTILWGQRCLYVWLSAAMLVSYSSMKVETRSKWLAHAMLNLGGYGSFLCAVTFGAYISELRGSARTWDKTEKTGTMNG